MQNPHSTTGARDRHIGKRVIPFSKPLLSASALPAARTPPPTFQVDRRQRLGAGDRRTGQRHRGLDAIEARPRPRSAWVRYYIKNCYTVTLLH